jgi:hypothetical protein
MPGQISRLGGIAARAQAIDGGGQQLTPPQGQRTHRGRLRRDRDFAEGSCLLAQQAARRAEPDRALSIGQTAGRHAQVEPGIGAVEGDEVLAVETGDAVLGAGPQVATGVLAEGQHGDLRQPVFGSPALQQIVGEGGFRLQRRRGRGDQQQCQQRYERAAARAQQPP